VGQRDRSQQKLDPTNHAGPLARATLRHPDQTRMDHAGRERATRPHWAVVRNMDGIDLQQAAARVDEPGLGRATRKGMRAPQETGPGMENQAPARCPLSQGRRASSDQKEHEGVIARDRSDEWRVRRG